MNPVVLYPQNAMQARLLRVTADTTGMKMVKFSQKLLEEMEEHFRVDSELKKSIKEAGQGKYFVAKDADDLISKCLA